jgi:hypothetical protein
MIYYKLSPFYITLLAMVLPLIISNSNLVYLKFAPFFITVFLFLLFSFYSQNNKYVSIRWLVFIFIICIHFVCSLLYNGSVSFGFYGLIITSIIYFIFFNSINKTSNEVLLQKWLFRIFYFYTFFLVLELLLSAVGYRDNLISLFSTDSGVKSFKDYNSAIFLHLIGFPDFMSGLNGMFLGSQSANQMMAGFLVLSAPLYKYQTKRKTYETIIFYISLFLFLITITNTVLLALLISFFLLVFIIKYSRFYSKIFKIFLFLIILSFHKIIIQLLFYRIEDFDRDVNEYSVALLSPLAAFKKMGIINLFLGTGASYDKLVDHADNGILMLMLQYGPITFGLLLILIIVYFINSFIFINKIYSLRIFLNPSQIRTVWLYCTNLFISLIFFISLIHYTPSIELGGAQIFSISISLTFFSRKLLEKKYLISSKTNMIV